MKYLKIPTNEEIDQISELVEFNPIEEKYWKNVKIKENAETEKEDYFGKIDFYLKELESVKNKFGDRIAIERRIKYRLGYNYEWIGTKVMKDEEDPLNIAKIFEQAIYWYQSADECVGYITDYVLRQAESCNGARYYRELAGIDDEVTKAFSDRSRTLINGFFSGSYDLEANIIEGDAIKINYIINTADKIIGSCGFRAYIGQNPQNIDPKNN